MSETVRILGIAGSFRRGSDSRAAQRASTQLVPEDASLDIFELDGIPGFNQDEEQNPPAKVAELKRRIREAGAILIVTPEYNYSIPGVLKNAMFPINQPKVMIGNAAERFDASGNLTDETTKKLIRQLLENLRDWTRRLRQPQ